MINYKNKVIEKYPKANVEKIGYLFVIFDEPKGCAISHAKNSSLEAWVDAYNWLGND